MRRELTRTIIQLSCDGRLVAGVGGAVAHHAERAGFNEASRDSLVSALEDFCRQTLPLLRNNGNGNGNRLAVAIEDFEDRIEIVVQHSHVSHSSTGINTFRAVSAPQPSPLAQPGAVQKARLLRTLDRVEYDARNGEMRTTLVKYLNGCRDVR